MHQITVLSLPLWQVLQFVCALIISSPVQVVFSLVNVDLLGKPFYNFHFLLVISECIEMNECDEGESTTEVTTPLYLFRSCGLFIEKKNAEKLIKFLLRAPIFQFWNSFLRIVLF